MRIKPPYIAIALLFLSWLVDYLLPQFRFIFGNARYFGILIFVLGLSTTFYSFYLFKKNKTPILPGQKPTFVVIEGPYKFTRNPMYLGVTIGLLGMSIYIGNLLSLLSPIIFFVVMNIAYVPFEEGLLEKTFGKQYLNYKKKVRRWI
ncbi:isoprenylcysteine carboxylmethyltransferase family protein [Candidatus Woesearchaeota archaeon]|nr:isoprenylcysteine carboxylmethyltransferase family protein [Candidatus Woesearchaeota archaeon]